MKKYEYELEKDITNCIPINKNRDLYVLETSFRKIQHPVHKRSMAKPYYAFHLVTKGSGTLIAPEGKYALRQGDIFIRFPLETIQYFDDDLDPWSYIFITFMGNHAEEYFSRLGYSPQKRILRTDENLTQLFCESVILPQKYHAAMDIIANSYISAIFSRLAVIYCSEYPAASNNIDNYINKAIDYIEANVSDSNMHAEDVAHYLGLNPDYFLRIFKKKTKTVFSKFLIIKRMNDAAQLMRKGETNISVISDTVGYNSTSYFTFSFKQYYGMVPSEYIRKISAEPVPE